MILRRKKEAPNSILPDLSKSPIKFDIEELNMISAYVISDNRMVTRGCLGNVRKLFDIMDEKLYKNDEQMDARIYFIKRVLDARLGEHIDNINVIKNYCKAGKYTEIIDDVLYSIEERYRLDSRSIKYVSNLIAERLTYSFVFSYKSSLSYLVEKIDLNDFESYGELITIVKDVISGLSSEIRKAERKDSDVTFDLSEENFANVVMETVNKLKAPSNKLVTGIQKLNEILGGGFEKKRVYLFLGITGKFFACTYSDVCVKYL